MRLSWLVVLVAALSSVLGAWFGARPPGGTSTFPEPLAPQTSSRDDAMDGAILAELRGLRADLVLRTASEPREYAGSATDGSADLIRALDSLTQALRERGASAQVGSSRASAPTPPSTAVGFPDVAALLSVDGKERRSGHLFWTLQDVVGRYGTPNFMTAADGMLQVGYRHPVETMRGTSFYLFDGLVVRTD